MLQIRNMQEKDIDQIYIIEQDNFTMPWSKRAFLDTLTDSKALYLVAAKENRILGYCGVYMILDEADINQIAVAKTDRRKGVARKLLHALFECLEQKGINAVTLEVRKSNEAAIALYKEMGFVTEGVRKGFYEKPTEDALIMWKR